MKSDQQPESTQSGIVEITRGPADLATPRHCPEGITCRYGVAFPFQVAPRTAALVCALRNEGMPVGDFENGTDVIIFDTIDPFPADRGQPLSRNDKYVKPDGERRIIIRYPISGGFIPLGARRADGTPHPHAGTGVGLCEALDFPMYGDGYYKKEDKTAGMVRRLEVRQLAYDGSEFRLLSTEVRAGENPLKAPGSDWLIVSNGLRMGVPDGDDLLLPGVATRSDPEAYACYPLAAGVSRWRRSDGQWRPVGFVPVAASDDTRSPEAIVLYGKTIPPSWAEPSLIRDTDGALLFTARGVFGRLDHLVRIWRSTDGGQTWAVAIDAPDAKGQVPITINQAVDGTPYIVTNQKGRERDVLILYPLKPDRSGLCEPLLVRNALDEFGPTPSGMVWFMDHPVGETVQLADGRWHSLLSYRVMDRGEHRGDAPGLQTGQYLEEVVSTGPAIARWRFD